MAVTQRGMAAGCWEPMGAKAGPAGGVRGMRLGRFRRAGGADGVDVLVGVVVDGADRAVRAALKVERVPLQREVGRRRPAGTVGVEERERR